MSYNGNHWIRRGGLRLFRGGAGTHHEYKTRAQIRAVYDP